MTGELGVGIIGCGNISTTYLSLGPMFSGFQIRACADIDMDAAKARGAEYGVRAMTVDELLAADDIDIIVNLTVPDAHSKVTLEILSAGKHAYSEKPLALSLEAGREIKSLAEEKGLRVGCAPDTFLGGAHQLARRELDDGRIGTVTSGTCHVLSHGMEHWHPNPDFFFKPGGGPVLDLGPYYLGNLIHLVGPIKRVAALASSATPTRTITSQPRSGETITVETPTNLHALLEFENGATVTLSASWDVWAHRHANMELYGTEGSMFVPDPNFFGGEVEVSQRDSQIQPVDAWDHPFGVPNQSHGEGMMANYRAVGLADMAAAIRDDRDHRCSLDRTLHAVDVMLAIIGSGKTGSFVDMTTSCDRPQFLGIDEARSFLR